MLDAYLHLMTDLEGMVKQSLLASIGLPAFFRPYGAEGDTANGCRERKGR